jgi:hypothetical protein
MPTDTIETLYAIYGHVQPATHDPAPAEWLRRRALLASLALPRSPEPSPA